MKTSSLIAVLEAEMQERGDLPVVIEDAYTGKLFSPFLRVYTRWEKSLEENNSKFVVLDYYQPEL